jgi:hypothetical protein
VIGLPENLFTAEIAENAEKDFADLLCELGVLGGSMISLIAPITRSLDFGLC